MVTGSGCGRDSRRGDVVVTRWFRDDEGGFTTVAVALSLLLCLALVFAAASAGWVGARSSETQRVADATALAGQNVVAAYSTIVQTLDACVLSMGLAGVIVLGAGLVLSCVPGLSSAGASMSEAGSRILGARRDFARTAGEGIERLESTLPLLIVANSASCVAANSDGGTAYVGCALPLPADSRSDFSALEADVDDAEMAELSREMGEVSDEVARARDRADEARERGWMADCGSSPYCLWERAGSLAGLPASLNPHYPTASDWTFGAPLERARNYYAARLDGAVVGGRTAEEITDAACRRAFYAYALGEVRGGSYAEGPDGTVSCDLPDLPRNADQTRGTNLYAQVVWPCTDEGGVRTLHSSLLCPGATGAASASASLAQLEAGAVAHCDVCGMDVGDMGRVASASTSIANGFEHHWRIIVEASRDYEQARNEQADAERRSRELAESGRGLFAQALETLSVGRPTLCPPGAWGCVAVVACEGTSVPSELTQAFLASAEVPDGAAVSAAALAPDESTAQNNVPASFLDGLSTGDSVLAGVASGVLELWGSLLVGYGSAYEGVSEAGGRFLDGLDGVLGGTVGSWLRGQLGEVMRATGFEPVDLRLRKPVLVNSQDVLDKGGLSQLSSVRSLVAALPASGSALDFARAMGYWLVDEVGGGAFTVATLEIPGTGLSIPLTIDLEGLGGAA